MYGASPTFASRPLNILPTRLGLAEAETARREKNAKNFIVELFVLNVLMAACFIAKFLFISSVRKFQIRLD